MIQEIPDRYWFIIRYILVGLFCLTALSMFIGLVERDKQRDQTLQLEMAKKSYCLRPVLGDSALQYQPCDMIVRTER